MFSNMDLRLLLKMIQPPMTTHGERVKLGTLGEKEIVSYAEDERKLSTISMAIDQFFDRCEDTVRHTDHSLLCWLRSQYPGKAYKGRDKPCGQLSSRRATIAEHCNRLHDWRSSPESRTNWNEVKIQSFCLAPGKQRWFIVDE